MATEPTFFAKRRLSVYFKGGRLMRYKKTHQRIWRFKWALTVQAGDAYACGGAIQSTYEHIQARENAAEKIELSGARGGMIAKVFEVADATAPQIIRLDKCYLDKFSMTYTDDFTEFWIQLEHELTDALHKFVKDYAFDRFWVEFEPAQQTLAVDAMPTAEEFFDKVAEALNDPDNPLQQATDCDDISMSIASGGKKLHEFKPKGRPN